MPEATLLSTVHPELLPNMSSSLVQKVLVDAKEKHIDYVHVLLIRATILLCLQHARSPRSVCCVFGSGW